MSGKRYRVAIMQDVDGASSFVDEFDRLLTEEEKDFVVQYWKDFNREVEGGYWVRVESVEV